MPFTGLFFCLYTTSWPLQVRWSHYVSPNKIYIKIPTFPLPDQPTKKISLPRVFIVFLESGSFLCRRKHLLLRQKYRWRCTVRCREFQCCENELGISADHMETKMKRIQGIVFRGRRWFIVVQILPRPVSIANLQEARKSILGEHEASIAQKIFNCNKCCKSISCLRVCDDVTAVECFWRSTK